MRHCISKKKKVLCVASEAGCRLLLTIVLTHPSVFKQAVNCVYLLQIVESRPERLKVSFIVRIHVKLLSTMSFFFLVGQRLVIKLLQKEF